MNRLIDKAILLLAALFLHTAIFSFTGSVIPLLAVIILSSLNSILDREWFFLCSFAGFYALCGFYPSFLCFLPVLLYDFRHKVFDLLFLAAIPLFAFKLTFVSGTLISLSAIFSCLLQLRTEALNRQKEMYYELKDSSKESRLLLEQQNRKLQEQQHYQMEMAKLAERNRIAREIHDNVGHVLASSILQTGALIATVSDEGTKQALSQLKDSLTLGMNSIRHSVHNLHEETFDLETEIQKLANSFSFCPLTFEYRVNAFIKKRVALAIHAIIKECLSNIIKHSNATRAEISVKEQDRYIRLIVKDNGTGGKVGSSGLGLTGIAERVAEWSGSFHCSAEDGFRVFAVIPKNPPEERL